MTIGRVAASTADVRAEMVLDADSDDPVEIDFVALNGERVAATNGNSHSSNNASLAKTKPIVGISRSAGGNRCRHPTEECLQRLHAAPHRGWSKAYAARERLGR
jgi:beta-lactamase superfamily II metal-dependent hydrolase